MPTAWKNAELEGRFGVSCPGGCLAAARLSLANECFMQIIHFDLSLELLDQVEAGTKPTKSSVMLKFTTDSSPWGFNFVLGKFRSQLVDMLHSILARIDFHKFHPVGVEPRALTVACTQPHANEPATKKWLHPN